MRPAAALSAVSLLLLVGCGGSGGSAKTADSVVGGGKTLVELWRAPGDDVAIVPGTDHYVPGDVRVSFLVVDASGREVVLPSAHVWLARGKDRRPFLESSAKLERIGVPGEAVADSTHIYVAHLRISKPGLYWLLAEPEGGKEKVQAIGNVDVAADDAVPAAGNRPPASDTPTLATAGGNASRVTTRVPPDTSLLRYSVAASLRAHVPFVVTFATPKFCESRTCGPVVDVVEETARQLEGSGVRFIHVEVYEKNDPANGYNRWMRAWHLDTEPWTFVVNRRGRIADRFQGVVSVNELVEAVRGVAGR
jgi:hypothetical protein